MESNLRHDSNLTFQEASRSQSQIGTISELGRENHRLAFSAFLESKLLCFAIFRDLSLSLESQAHPVSLPYT